MLTASRKRTLRAVGDTIFPSLSDGDPAGGDILPEAFDEFLPSLAADKQKGVGLLLTIIEIGALFRYARRFSGLSPEKRERYLEGWGFSRLAFRRVVYRALRDLCATLYYQDSRTWPAIGYAGPPVARERAEGTS